MPNNFYAIDNLINKDKRFVFLAHDSEHSMMIEPVFSCKDRNYSLVSKGSSIR